MKNKNAAVCTLTTVGNTIMTFYSWYSCDIGVISVVEFQRLAPAASGPSNVMVETRNTIVSREGKYPPSLSPQPIKTRKSPA